MSEVIESRFAEELKAYERKKAELLALCEGKFAVFKGTEFVGVFDTPGAAYSAGIQRCGNDSFLIKPVLKEEPVERIPALHLGLIHACL